MSRRLTIMITLAIALVAPGVAPVAAAEMAPLDVVRYGLPGAVTHLDPALPGETSEGSAINLVSGKLLRFDKDGIARLDLAESAEASSDGLTWTMKLRDGLTYSDGTELTVDDVLFAWDRAKDAPPTNKALISKVTGVEAIDDRTLQWTLSSPEPDFLTWFARYNMSIHPMDRVSADPEGYFREPVSAGPYKISSGAPGDAVIILDENESYPLGPMSVKRLELNWVPDGTTRALQLAQGELDYVYELPAQASSFPDEVLTFPVFLGGVFHLTFNMQLPDTHCLSNRDVRAAIALAMDRSDINERALFGNSPPSTGYFYAGEPLALDLFSTSPQLEEAQALLATTPFADGCEFAITTYGPRPGYVDSILVMNEQLKPLNISVTPNGLEVGVALDFMANSPDYEAGWAVTGNPGTPASYLASQWVPGNFWADRARYDNPEMTALIDSLGTITDPDARVEVFNQIQRLGYEDMSIVPCCERSLLAGSRIGTDHVTTYRGGSEFIVVPVSSME